MKRRSFLTMLGAATVGPALSTLAAPAPIAAGYNRYMYGLAVFHARTRASISEADLISRLKVNAAQAEAMIGEMTSRGVITPVLSAANSVLRAVEPHHGRLDLERNARVVRAVEKVFEEDVETLQPEDVLQGDKANELETDHGQV